MGRIVRFDPHWREFGGNVLGNASIQLIKNEPMVFSADIPFAYQQGGWLTRRVLDDLLARTDVNEPPGSMSLVVDTRVALLMPGQASAIPGWHCDAVERKNGEPNCDKIGDPRFKNWCVSFTIPRGTPEDQCVQSSEHCRTEYIHSWADVEVRDPTRRVWEQVHNSIKAQGLVSRRVSNDRIFEFDQACLHRAAPAEESVWRFWLRASWYPRPARNEVRRNCNVYTTEGGGW